MSENKKENLTKEQEEVLFDRGNNLLISASAGSGKTFVMIERIANMLKKHEVSVDELLVVTFTKAAASEMRAKLVKKLEKLADSDEFVKEQLLNISSSNISTLHSFCAKLLRTYFYVIGLDPTFILIDEVESKALKEKAIAKFIDDRFLNKDEKFFDLVEILSINRNDDSFKEVIFKIYDYILTQIDFVNNFNTILSDVYNLDLNKNCATKFIKEKICEDVEAFKIEADCLLKTLSSLNATKLIEVVNGVYLNLLKVKRDMTFEQVYKNLNDLESVPRLPSKVDESEIELKECVREFKDRVSEFFKTTKENVCFDSLQNMSERLKITKGRASALLEYSLKFKEIYDELKKEKVALDFNDLEQYSLKLFENREICETIKKQFKFVFVDEYQDTNLVQESLLKAVSSENNLFMVGDVKQSIYKFRASEPEIFVNKYENYSKGLVKNSKVINLNHNFRSHQDILKFSNIIFDRCMTPEFGKIDYKNTSNLKKGGENYPAVGTEPIVEVCVIDGFSSSNEPLLGLEPYSVKNHTNSDKISLKKAECEGRLVCEKIKLLLGQDIYDEKLGGIRKIELKDIAILTASRGDHLSLILNELDKQDIAYKSDIEADVFDDPVVSVVESLLELTVNRFQDLHLLSVLNSQMFNFLVEELAQIRIKNPNFKFYYEAFYASLSNECVASSIRKKIKEFVEILDYLTYESKFLKVDELIVKILKLTNFDLKLRIDQNGKKSLNLIKKLINYLVNKSYNINANKFLDYIKENSIKFEIESKDEGIEVTTIHKSKGLEYPVVILVGCGQQLLKPNREEVVISKQFGIGLDFFDVVNRTKQKSPVKVATILEQKRSELEERLRLLYVALTRPKNKLILIGSLSKDNKFPRVNKAKTFFDWILPSLGGDCCGGFKLSRIDSNKMSELKIVDGQRRSNAITKKANSQFIQEIRDVVEFRYPFENQTKMPTKTSVSEILNGQNEESFIPSIFESSGNKDAIQEGLGFHKLLSLIDFEIDSKEDLDQFIDKLLKNKKITSEEISLVDKTQVLNLLKNPKFADFVKGNCYREKEFIALMSVDKSVDEKMIVQGVVDLFVVKPNGTILLLDYKTNKFKKESDFVKKYSEQLNIYANALESSFKMKVAQKVIYSTNLNKFIEIL